jgi:transcriptional regulator with XRE-family HTH domain
MQKVTSLVDALKRELKARGITYADLAGRISLSEASVKRMFAQRNFTLERLDQILQATGIEFRELSLALQEETRLISQLTLAQEKEIISDPKLFVTAVSALHLFTVEQIMSLYQFTLPELIGNLVRLDKIGFLELLPNNRVKLLVSRTFHWLPNGPIQTYFREQAASDFLASQFAGDLEMMQMVNVVLSPHSAANLINRMRQLVREISQQHQDDVKLPFDQRHTMSFMLAARSWIPPTFQALLKKP